MGPDVTQLIHFYETQLMWLLLMTNSILADDINRTIPGNLAMQVAAPDGQIWIQCKWRHLMVKFATNVSGATWWPNLTFKQLVPLNGLICNQCRCRHLEGKICEQFKWCHMMAKFASGAMWQTNFKTLPEAQRTQGIEFKTWIILFAELNLYSL